MNGMSGWVRACGECGEIDMHSVYPIVSMVDDAYWRCGHCGAGAMTALHLAFRAEREPSGATAGVVWA